MSKTIQTQIEKCRLLVDKLKNRSADAEARGITAEALAALEGKIAALDTADKECEEVRKLVAEHVKKANTLLGDIKEEYTEMKKKIKSYYPQTSWIEFGVPDKR